MNTTSPNKLYCIGHRGAAGHAPENTLLSIQTAIDMGVDCVEVDVYLVEDELIVIHDATLKRTTNGRGWLKRKTLQEIRELDAGKGEKIPFLYEVLDLIDKQVAINIELKGSNTAAPVSRLVQQYIGEKHWSPDYFLISSFKKRELKKIRKLMPDIRIGCLFATCQSNSLGIADILNAWSVHFNKSAVNRYIVHRSHQNGFKVFVYTVNTLRQLERMVRMNVDGAFSNYPDRVVQFNKTGQIT